MTERQRQRFRQLLRIVLFSAVGGGLFGLLLGDNWTSVARGVGIGLAISAVLASIETWGGRTALGSRLRRRPFAVVVVARAAGMLLVILAVVQVGFSLFPGDTTTTLGADFWWAVGFSIAFTLAISFTMQISELLGQGELGRFVMGRYYRPRREERILLFCDLVGSTALAERLGDRAFLDLLNQLYADMADPILDRQGEVHKYVGDEIIISWTVERGLPDARCLRCADEIRRRLTTLADAYRHRFGTEPRFRYGLHLGPVVVGELGSLKREIAMVGDTINTVARLVDVCRSANRTMVVSQPLLDRLALPPGLRVEPLGPLVLRGRSQPLATLAVEPADAL